MTKIRALFAGLLLVVSATLLPAAASAGVYVEIDISTQKMVVKQDGSLLYTWQVSTAKTGSYTVRGNFRVQGLDADHYSKRYNNAPMPHSIFFFGHYAIHGTIHEKKLGRPASHGCVRISRTNAAKLFALVQRAGTRNVSIAIRN